MLDHHLVKLFCEQEKNKEIGQQEINALGSIHLQSALTLVVLPILTDLNR
jgi:hypothetical protein